MNTYILLNITTEGQTEFQFVRQVLYNHLQPFRIFCDVRQPPFNNNPELINDKRDTSPSHRILSLIPEYQKVSSGSLLADLISIDILRAKCKHFNDWLTKLESINFLKN